MPTELSPLAHLDPVLAAWAALALLAALLVGAGWHDVRTQRIPNVIPYAGVSLALLLHAVIPAGTGLTGTAPGGLGAAASLAGLAVGLAAMLPLYLARAAGAGDVKLMAMVGAFLGPVGALGAAVSAFAAGMVLAFGYAARAGAVAAMLRNVRSLLYAFAGRAGARPFDPRTDSVARMPYGLAIAAGTAAWLLLAQHAMG